MRLPNVRFTLPAVLALIWIGTGLLSVSTAQQKGSPSTPAADASASDPMQEVTPEREAAAETFARLHHPELAELLVRLKQAAPAEYHNAVRDLFRESERLARLKSREPARYELELANWKIGSRIHLATARLTMTDSESLRTLLEELVAARLDVRQQLLQFDRDRLSTRLEKLDSDLQNLADNRSELIAQDVDRLLKAARARVTPPTRPRPSPNTRSAVETNVPASRGAAASAPPPSTPSNPPAPERPQPNAAGAPRK